MDLSVIWALKLNQTLKKETYRNIFREIKNKKIRQKLRQIPIKLYQVCLPLLASFPCPSPLLLCHSSVSKTDPPPPPPPLPPPPQPIPCAEDKDEDLHHDPLPPDE